MTGFGSRGTVTRTPSPARWSAPCAHDSGCCEGADFFHSASFQYRRATLEGRSGRGHVVDQYHHAGSPSTRPTRQAESVSLSTSRLKCKCIADIPMALFPREINLRLCVDHPPQQRDHRQPEVNGEVMRLVEAARVFTTRMQRHRHYAVGLA